MSARAIDTLRACDIIAAEDTRRTRALLSHFGIPGKHVVTHNAHADTKDVERLILALAAGESVALVTDAGTPSVSDPGETLVQAAVRADIRVVPIPGASAVTAEASVSARP